MKLLAYTSHVTFPEYIERKYLEWQNEQGKRKSIDEFAVYLGVSQPTLSLWMSGKRSPSNRIVDHLAEIFGNEIYDVTGLPRPNPYLQRINRVWEFLPEAMQKAIAELEAQKSQPITVPSPAAARTAARAIINNLHSTDPATVRQTLLGMVHTILTDRHGKHLTAQVVMYFDKKKR